MFWQPGASGVQHGPFRRQAESGQQLLEIINDIRDVSKIEAGQLQLALADFDVRALIEQTCSLAGLQARNQAVKLGCRIRADVPGGVYGDAGRFRQILTNLLSNAVKFTAEGSVTVHVASRPSSGIRVEVTDTGIGIDAAALERIFEPFTQADPSTTRTFGGTGLGLTITRQLVEPMGGTIGVESTLGLGSTFWFEVTLDPTMGTDTTSAATREPGGAGISAGADPPLVLVVDDNQVNQAVAVRTLDRCGFRTDTADNGLEALDALEAKHYDAVLMDCQMPVMNGYDAVAELRRREQASGSHVPVIAMTASTMAGDRELCLQAGMDDYIAKPVRAVQLTEVLNRWTANIKHDAPVRATPDPVVGAFRHGR